MPVTPINSLQNPRVKAAVRLRDARHRRKQARIVIDGAREIARALAAGVQVVEGWICDECCRGAEAQAARELLLARAAECLQVSPEVFARLAFGSRADGVLAVAETPQRTLDELSAQLFIPGGAAVEPPLVAVLEGVEKPGNVGAVLRSADGAGLSAVIVADAATDLFNPNAIRASLGTVFTLPLCAAAAGEVRDWLRRHELSVVAARVEGSVPYTSVDYRRPTAIVLGSEARGLSELWRDLDATAVRLPMRGRADSLNVSAAAAVLFYEARRQRDAAAIDGPR